MCLPNFYLSFVSFFLFIIQSVCNVRCQLTLFSILFEFSERNRNILLIKIYCIHMNNLITIDIRYLHEIAYTSDNNILFVIFSCLTSVCVCVCISLLEAINFQKLRKWLVVTYRKTHGIDTNCCFCFVWFCVFVFALLDGS